MIEQVSTPEEEEKPIPRTFSAKITTFKNSISKKWGFRLSFLYDDRDPQIFQSDAQFEHEIFAHTAGDNLFKEFIKKLQGVEIISHESTTN